MLGLDHLDKHAVLTNEISIGFSIRGGEANECIPGTRGRNPAQRTNAGIGLRADTRTEGSSLGQARAEDAGSITIRINCGDILLNQISLGGHEVGRAGRDKGRRVIAVRAARSINLQDEVQDHRVGTIFDGQREGIQASGGGHPTDETRGGDGQASWIGDAEAGETRCGDGKGGVQGTIAREIRNRDGIGRVDLEEHDGQAANFDAAEWGTCSEVDLVDMKLGEIVVAVAQGKRRQQLLKPKS